MTDPGLPPRPRSLNLLESLVKEEEEKEDRHTSGLTIPTAGDTTADGSSPEFYDSEKQQILSREQSATSFSEYKMKDTKTSAGVSRANPNAGFKGKKFRKQRSRSSSEERAKHPAKKPTRPFSADYNQQQRKTISSKRTTNGRPKSSKGPKGQKRTVPAKDKRSRSPRSYSSDTYSSDDEYLKKRKYRYDSESSDTDKKKDNDSFFDSDRDEDKNQKDGKTSEKRDSSLDSYSRRDRKSSENSKRDSSSDSYTSDEGDRNKLGTSKQIKGDKPGTSYGSKQVNGTASRSKICKTSKTLYVAKDGHQRTRSDSESSDYQRMVVVDDYTSSFTSSSDEENKHAKTQSKTMAQPPKPSKKSKPLLSRKKRENYRVFQIDPDLYIEGKLQQKYCELEELMACSFVDQKSHMTRHHLYQMEILRDQYHDVSKGRGKGRPSSAIIIPRSLPGDIRRAHQQRPSSGKLPVNRYRDNDQDSCDNAYGTIRSVMAAERARKTDKIRTDIHADRPISAKRKKKKTIDAKLINKSKYSDSEDDTSDRHRRTNIETKIKGKYSDTEEEISERPSISSKASSKGGTNSTNLTPRSGPSIDHHIKYSENEKLKKWLKEKDKIYRQHVKEEKKKKREEREKIINEANDRIEKRIKSQKVVQRWMKEKDQDLYKKHKADKKREKIERKEREKREMEISLPGNAMQIRPQSALSARSDDIHIDEEQCKGENTPEYVKQQVHEKRDIEEENKQTKLAHDGPHPPQTKFIYKRPVAGKIKLRMQARGKSPVAQKSNTDKKDNEKDSEMQVRGRSPVAQKSNTEKKDDGKDSENENGQQTRISYDEWVKKKRTDDVIKRKEVEAQRRKELAKSDPELDRIIPDIAKKRIEDKLSSRKRIDTGMKKYDDKANKSFGGADFNGDDSGNETAINPYRLKGDNRGSNKQTGKQVKRPSTAPAGRVKVPHPQKSASSPRKAIIPKKVDKIMSNEDQSNPYQLPFPPEKGIPEHVASRQKKIFADRVVQNLDAIEQRALLNAELIREGVANNEISANDNLDRYETKMEEKANEKEEAEKESQPSISVLMYSPKKKDSSSDSSEEENEKDEHSNEKNEIETKDENSLKRNEQGKKSNEDEVDIEKGNGEKAPVEKNHYKTFENLNELSLDSPRAAESDGSNSDLGVDIEKLKERVAALKTDSAISNVQSETNKNEKQKDEYEENDNNISENEENGTVDETDSKRNDPQIVSILKENKTIESIPVPEKSDEPNISEHNSGDHENPIDEDLTSSKKRVSFNDQTEVFQSYDSSSTGTVTPDQEEFDAKAESLDYQQNGDGYYEEDWDNFENSEPPTPEPPLIASEGEKVSINIAGFELNPTVIESKDEKEGESDEEKQAEETSSENQPTFITNPSGGSSV